MDSSNFNVNQGNVENSPRKSGRWASRLRNSPLWPGLSLGLGSRVWYVWYSVLLRVVTPCHTSHSSHPSHPSHRIHPFCFFLCSISLHRNLERKNFNPKASQLCPLRIVFPSDTNMTRVEAFDSTAWLLPWLSRHFPKHTDYRSYRSHVSSQLWDDENIGKSEWKSSCKRKTSDHGDQRVINESEMQPFTCLFLKMSDHEYELDIKKTQSLKHPPIQSNSIQFTTLDSTPPLLHSSTKKTLACTGMASYLSKSMPLVERVLAGPKTYAEICVICVNVHNVRNVYLFFSFFSPRKKVVGVFLSITSRYRTLRFSTSSSVWVSFRLLPKRRDLSLWVCVNSIVK